jgi:hypothetical protein
VGSESFESYKSKGKKWDIVLKKVKKLKKEMINDKR